jgi:polysaccharide biosynthesis transport protein
MPVREEAVAARDEAVLASEAVAPPSGGLASRVAAIVRWPRYRESQNVAAPPPEPAVNTADDLRETLAISPRIAVLGAPGMNTSQTAIRLARTLADEFRVVLVGLASGDSAIRTISSEPSASGLAELASRTATTGEIITKDRLSPLHLVGPGRVARERGEILAAPGVTTSIDALACSYDYVVIDAGEGTGPVIERISAITPNAVLVVDPQTSAATAAARERLVAAGFTEIMLLPGTRMGATETAAAA